MKKGFTLIELLIVIGIIAILAAGVIIAINPGRQFAQARNSTRDSHVRTLYTSIISYQVDSYGNLSGLGLPTELTEICNTNEVDPSSCGTLVDLSTLTSEGYINQIPVDPQGGVDSNGTGYFINEDLALVAENAEDRFIGQGITESEYLGGGFTCGDTLTDSRDSKTYPTVDISGQCWMEANLNIGTMLPSGSDRPSDNGTIEKWCYDSNTSNCDTYGGLYEWNEAMQYSTTEGEQGVCPSGWHIPTDSEWHTLESYLTADGNTCDLTREDRDCDPAGGALKEAGTTHWSSETCGTTTCNSSGFTALPGGHLNFDDSFQLINSYGRFLSSSYDSGTSQYTIYTLDASNSTIMRTKVEFMKASSIRCIKDEV